MVFSYRKWRNKRDVLHLHVKTQQRQMVFITAVTEVTTMMAPFQNGTPNFKCIPKFSVFLWDELNKSRACARFWWEHRSELPGLSCALHSAEPERKVYCWEKLV